MERIREIKKNWEERRYNARRIKPRGADARFQGRLVLQGKEDEVTWVRNSRAAAEPVNCCDRVSFYFLAFSFFFS